MGNLSSILESLITTSGFSENELSRKMNITTATLNKIKTGVISNPTLQTLNNIAQYFGITIDQLTGKSPLDTYFVHNLHCIPFIESQNIIHTPLSKLDFSTHNAWKRIELDCNSRGHNLFATIVHGEAMAPLFDDKTTCIVDQDEPLKNNALVIVRINNHEEIIARRLLIDGYFKVLKPLNPSFPNLELTSQDTIIGTVIAVFRDFN